MDFLDPKKTKRNAIQLMVGYVLVAIAILLATLVLIYYAYGFGVNRNGDLLQKGLVFVSSQPSGSQLYVSGKRVNNTNTKLNLAAGKYTFDIARTGYQTWHRNIEIDGGSVNHYDYPFLFPNTLNTSPVRKYETAPVLTTQSPDRRWLLAMTDAVNATFDMYDLNSKNKLVDPTKVTTVTVPPSLLTASSTPPQWEIMEWSSNNRHVLLKRTYTSAATQKVEYILVDRQRLEGSHNLSKELNISPTQIVLQDKQPDRYYIYNASTQTVSTVTLNNPTPTVVLTDVLAFKSYAADTFLYVTKDSSATDKVRIHFKHGSDDYPLRTLTTSDTYLLDVAQYSGDWYVIAGSHAENRVYIYRNPQSTSTSARVSGAIFALRLDGPTSVSFSATAQYMAAQNGHSVRVYDAENQKSYYYEINPSLDAPQIKATWMDGDRFTYVSGGKQVVIDYDNLNKRTLVPAAPDYLSAFDSQYKYLYTFTKSADSPAGLTLSTTALRTTVDL